MNLFTDQELYIIEYALSGLYTDQHGTKPFTDLQHKITAEIDLRAKILKEES